MSVRHGSRFYSLTGKLVLLFLSMAVLFVVLVGGSMGKVFQVHFESNIRPHLRQYLDYVQKDIGIPASRERAAELADKLKVDIHIVDANGSWSSSGRRLDYAALKKQSSFEQGDTGYTVTRLGNHEVFSARQGDTVLYFDVADIHPQREGRGIAPILLLLFVLFLLYYLTRRMIRPVGDLIAGVRNFGQGDLDYRININRKDELGELAQSFNEMAKEIQRMLDAKRHLLLAISHELRSPITRAKVSLEMLDEESQRRELNEDLTEMDRLIEELLETERLSTRHRTLNKKTWSLQALVGEVLQDHFAGATIHQALSTETISVEADGPRIKLLLKNLLENALRHTPAGADQPLIAVEKHVDTAVIIIRDYGEGVAAEHIPYLIEPFYRGDKSRHRDTGGYGLGLYLCQVIVEAHEGAMTIESEEQRGVSVAVELPCLNSESRASPSGASSRAS